MVPRPQGDMPFLQGRWAWQRDCSGSRGQGLATFLKSWYIREREILPSSLELWYAKDGTGASSLCHNLRICCECSTQSNRTWCFTFSKIPLDFDMLWSWKSTLWVAIWCPHVLQPLDPNPWPILLPVLNWASQNNPGTNGWTPKSWPPQREFLDMPTRSK